jgi:phosphopantetheinyl transferase (holo-ACP synthase)
VGGWLIGLLFCGHSDVVRYKLSFYFIDFCTPLLLVQDVSPEEEVLLRFSLKESIYKAMHPLICQYVGFMEAEVQPLSDGTATATFMLKSGAHHQFESVTVHWQRIGDYFLSTSSVRLRSNAAVVPIADRNECEL